MRERPHNDPPTDSLTTMSEAVASPRGGDKARPETAPAFLGRRPSMDGSSHVACWLTLEPSSAIRRIGRRSPSGAPSTLLRMALA